MSANLSSNTRGSQYPFELASLHALVPLRMRIFVSIEFSEGTVKHRMVICLHILAQALFSSYADLRARGHLILCLVLAIT